MHGQKVPRLESQIDRLQGHQRANQQGRADQQDQGETQLADHQAIVKTTPSPTARGASRPLLEGLVDADVGSPPGGHQAEQQSRQQRDPQGETEDPQVDVRLLQTRDVRRAQGHQSPDRAKRQEQAQNAGRQTEQKALGEHLTHEAASPGSERHAHGHLTLPNRGAGQEQIGDIRTGNQQHKSRRPQ